MYHKRVDYLKHLQDPSWTEQIEEERKNIRQENTTALSYSTLWLGLASVLVVLVAQLFGTQDGQDMPGFLAYIVSIFLLSIVILLTACMLFWHGSSTDHKFEQYAELNENGDSFVMVGSLLLIVGLSFLCSFYLLSYSSLGKWVSLYGPAGLVAIGFALLDLISVRTDERAIVKHYIIEAARFPFYRWSQETIDRLIAILEDKKMGMGLFILVTVFGVIIGFPVFLV